MNLGIGPGVRMAIIQCLFTRNYTANKVTITIFLLLPEGRKGKKKKDTVFEMTYVAVMKIIA